MELDRNNRLNLLGDNGLSRRKVLQTLGVTGLATTGLLTFGQDALAQGEVALRWWSPQASPAQAQTYKAQIASFEAMHPNVKVIFEPTSDEGYPAQFAAAFAAKQVPDIVTHLPSFSVQSYYAQGLVEPMDDVIAAVGQDKYFPGANNVYRTADGKFCGTGIGNTAADMLWVRKDLMAKAGIDQIPTTWDELRSACKKMQGGGVFGAPLPYGLNSMTSLLIIGFIHRAGGQILSSNMDVAIDTDATLNALEFYKSMRELSPSGATSYSWGDSLTAFVSGATATGIYGGRVLANVNAQNPKNADQITCATYPTMSKSIAPWTFNDFPSVFIPKGVRNLEASKQLAAYLFDAPGYIRQLLAAPGHVLPVLKTIAADTRYLDNPLIKKYRAEVELMAGAAAAGHNLGYETTKHKSNRKAGEITSSNALAEMVQRVTLNNENPKKVVGDTAKKIERIMKG